MSGSEGLQLDLTELEKFLETSTRDNVKNSLNKEISRVNELLDVAKRLEAQEEPVPVTSNVEKTESTLVFNQISSYSWDEEGVWVKVYVSLEGVGELAKENVTCQFSENEFNLAVVGYQRKNVRLCLSPLNQSIKVAESKILVKKNMVIVKMRKEEDETWGDLLEKKQVEEKQGGQGGMPGGMGGMGGGMGGMPGMEGMGGMGGMGGPGGMGGMADMMKGMGGMGGPGGMGGMADMMKGMGGMGGPGGMGGMADMMKGMGGMGGPGGMEGEDEGEDDMGGMPGMPGMGGPEGENGANPQEGMMDMMKKMYEEGDDDMKAKINEAMAKAQDQQKQEKAN